MPGLDGTSLLSAPLVDRLAELGIRTEVLAYPGRGSQDYASLADALRIRLPTTPFVLLGESFAGPLAIQLAAEAMRRKSDAVLGVAA
jgi:surfactin synthase thioesterase subunit